MRNSVQTTEAIGSETSRPALYLALTKPDVSFLVVMTTVAGYALGTRGPLDWMRMAHTVFGTTLIAAGTSALNHYFERDTDALMRRTASRPLPSGQLIPREAFLFGIVLIAVGTLYLALATNAFATLLGILTSIAYLCAYTPLKRKTTLATMIGAFPGAVPPLIGWVAARGTLGMNGWILFAMLFLWQFPHFDAIAWVYREDYARAGIQMLPVVDREGRRTFREILLTAALLVPVSLLPALTGLAGAHYFFGALVLGILLVEVCLWAAASKTNIRAKWLMHATVLHLPLLLGLLIYDKFTR
ncbi:MAG: heme o synthase [Candidatus Acidiferrales bacterium]|jgi:protoheme IX farnesyltransferase